MSFAGFGQGANAGIQGANAMTAAQSNGQTLQDQMRTAQAQAMLAKALQQYAGGGQPQGAAMSAPTAPGAPPSGGVSPQGMGQPPAGNAPGGAGPSSPMGGALPPQGNAMSAPSGGLDIARLAAAAQGQGGSSGAQGALAQMLMKSLQPQANNAVKLDLGQLHSNTQEDIADKNNASRSAIAAANNTFKMPASQKPLNDPKFRKLEVSYNNAVKAYGANPTDDNYKAQVDAAKAYNDYTPGGAAQKTTTSAPQMVEVISPDGTPGTIPSDQLSDALTQGYKQK